MDAYPPQDGASSELVPEYGVTDTPDVADRLLKNANDLTRPAPARQDAPFRKQGGSERNGEEVHTKLCLTSSLLISGLCSLTAMLIFPAV